MGGKPWSFEELEHARAYLRGQRTDRPARSVGGLRSRLQDEISFLTIEQWSHVPSAERHRLTKALVEKASTEPFALGEKATAQLFVERFTGRILPEAILRRDEYPPEGDKWSAEVRAALWASSRPKVSA